MKKREEKDTDSSLIPLNLTVKNIQNVKRKFNVNIKCSFNQKDPLIEWKIKLKNDYNLSPKDNKEINEDFDIEGNKSRDLNLEIDTPRGGYMNDSLTVNLTINSEDGINKYNKIFKVILRPVIIIAKCTIGKELDIAIDLSNHGEKDRDDRKKSNPNAENEIMAIMSPYEIKGYFFIETMHVDRVELLARQIRGFKGLVSGEIDISEIEKYLTPKPAVTGLEMGALVEIVEGPFKGERAKITSIDAAREEVTVQLIESMVPIPVTVKAEAIRNLDKA
ncbi:antitermination protein NusG [Acidiplasma aeolicum]|uniref:Transcription elongation factor Spt5 n=1 Tax=Acidiplasma aeolicum TaxID=507754 RepID=A0A0P9GYW3_9ARCH|nr:antitermination protein NusG [Acidiplasma aeolicum]